MLKGKLTGRIQELERLTGILKNHPEIERTEVQKPVQNRNSVYYREYLTIELKDKERAFDPVDQKLEGRIHDGGCNCNGESKRRCGKNYNH